MIKLILLLAFVFGSEIARAQKTTMILEMSNGERISIDVDSIAAMHITPLSPSENRVVNLNARDRQANLSSLAPNVLDDCTFQRKSGLMFFVFAPGYGFVLDPFRYVRPDSVLESITFQKFIADTTQEQKLFEGLVSQWVDSSVYIADRATRKRYDLNTGVTTNFDLSDLSFEFNRNGTKLLYTARKKWYDNAGILVELDLGSGHRDTLSIDSSVTNGRYIGETDNIVYYSKGSFNWERNRDPDDAGYYLFDRVADTTRFLVKHIVLDMEQVLSGFDVSSNGRTILLPNCSFKKVSLIEYNIDSAVSTLLPINWDVDKADNLLWVQYSSNDSLILYSLGGVHYAASILGGESEVGIINRKTLDRKVIPAAPNYWRPFSILFPRWSPDDSAITYGAAEIPPYVLDYIGPYYIYIKKL